MIIIHDPAELPPIPKGCALTIGNFDGVHLGHQLLLRRVAENARVSGAASAAITFEPHPIRVLAPARAPKLLTTFNERARLIAGQNIEMLFALPFTRDLARLTPAQFVDDVLVAQMRVLSVCVGPNFRFGYRQSGDVSVLADLCRERGIALEIVPAVQMRDEIVSSTAIRNFLSEGKVEKAARMLARPFSNSGIIVPGRGEGRRAAVPTLNLKPDEEMIPKPGVYIVEAELGGVRHQALTNIGYQPTFGDHPLAIETYLLRFEGAVAEASLKIHYLRRLRDEVKFPNPAALKLHIEDDVRRALRYFRLRERLVARA